MKTYRKTENPFGHGIFWIEFDDGQPFRGLWCQQGSYSGEGVKPMNANMLAAAVAVCGVMGWTNEGVLFDRAYKGSKG